MYPTFTGVILPPSFLRLIYAHLIDAHANMKYSELFLVTNCLGSSVEGKERCDDGFQVLRDTSAVEG